jgi:hypothetical protein
VVAIIADIVKNKMFKKMNKAGDQNRLVVGG